MSIAHCKTLVLNADYRPLSIFPLSLWDFASTLSAVVSGKAVAVDYHDVEVRSARQSWPLPSVVAMTAWTRPPEGVAFNRRNILVRDNFSCQYCGCRLSMSDLTFDHVIPRSAGGRTNFDNIVAACAPCNSRKANRRDIRPRIPPRVPSPWEMARIQPPDTAGMHPSWRCYLEACGIAPAPLDADRAQMLRDADYWSGDLERD